MAALRALVALPALAAGSAMPVVSTGTWTWGSFKKKFATEIVMNWLDLGFRGIDTAYLYFDQDKVATAVAASGVAREDLFITSKIPDCDYLAAGHLIEYDLNKLNTKYIDLMLIHQPIGFPGDCADAWNVLEKYVAEGKLRAIGVSNFKPAQLQKIISSTEFPITVPIAVNQIEYNVFSHDEETIAFCDAHNITIEAWSPLGDAHGGHSVFKDETIRAMASAHNVSAAQVALRWIVQRGHVLTVLSGSKEHQANDADLFAFTLSDEEMGLLMKLQDKSEVQV